jgi:hypothetical protein
MRRSDAALPLRFFALWALKRLARFRDGERGVVRRRSLLSISRAVVAGYLLRGVRKRLEMYLAIALGQKKLGKAR